MLERFAALVHLKGRKFYKAQIFSEQLIFLIFLDRAGLHKVDLALVLIFPEP